MGLDRPLEADFGLMFYSAHEVPDPDRLFVEMGQLLRSGGHLLIVEPVGHVTAGHFGQLLSLAAEAGLQVASRPRVRWSHAALLVNASNHRPASP